MADAYDVWVSQVQAALRSINMAMDDWQKVWRFDFRKQFDAGASADEAAIRANKFWWRQQRKHDIGLSQPAPVDRAPYATGDHVKVEFADDGTGMGEWMWLRVTGCDDQKQLVFGVLDSEPLNDYDGRIGVGSELAVAFSRVREHRKRE